MLGYQQEKNDVNDYLEPFMKILLTNDDGYQAPGIQILYETLSKIHDVILIAPDREKSAVGHGITLIRPLRHHPVQLNNGDNGYALNGTPADCIKLGLFDLFDQKPDIVISGINPGSNTGININYSGTVAAAREACLNGIPSMAVSIQIGDCLDYQGLALFISNLLKQIQPFKLPAGSFLNINAPGIPMKDIQGVRITRQAANNLSEQFEKRQDPRQRPYFWYGKMNTVNHEPGTDNEALSDNCISITPIQCDMTDHESLATLADLKDMMFN